MELLSGVTRAAWSALTVAVLFGLGGCDGGTVPTGVDGGGGADAGETCVSDVACAADTDCQPGHRCNTRLGYCVEINCGTEGASCTDSDHCSHPYSCSGYTCALPTDDTCIIETAQSEYDGRCSPDGSTSQRCSFNGSWEVIEDCAAQGLVCDRICSGGHCQNYWCVDP